MFTSFNLENINDYLYRILFCDDNIDKIIDEFMKLNIYITHIDILYIFIYLFGYNTIYDYFIDDKNDDKDTQYAYNDLMLKLLYNENNEELNTCCVCNRDITGKEYTKCSKCDSMICGDCSLQLIFRYCPSCYKSSIKNPIYYKSITNVVVEQLNMSLNEMNLIKNNILSARNFISTILDNVFILILGF